MKPDIRAPQRSGGKTIKARQQNPSCLKKRKREKCFVNENDLTIVSVSKSDIVIYTYIPRTREAEAGKLRLSSQSELHSKTISKNIKKYLKIREVVK